MPEPDEWLMQQVVKGSTPHLETLLRRYAQAVLTFATRLTGSVHRGEEAMQEVFLAVWLKRGTYKYPRYFRPWLFRIAHNKCRELARKHDLLAGRFDRELDPEALAPAQAGGRFPAPADAAIATEASLQVERAVARLPEQQRAILVMHLWNGMSYTEIAEALEAPEGTVRSNMHYALANVRRILEARLVNGAQE